MDPDAGSVVLDGVTKLALVGAGMGAVLGRRPKHEIHLLGFPSPLVKRFPSLVLALGTAFNCGVGGLAFFSLREYFIGPLLVRNLNSEQYVRRREAILHGSSNTLPSPSIHDIRTKKLLDTALSGAVAGAILYPLKPEAHTPTASPHLLPNNTPEHQQSSPPSQNQQSAQDPPKAISLSERIMNAMTWVAPVKKLSDEEYMALMERQRVELEKQLQGLKRELDQQKSEDEKRKGPS
ncbi:hypothetical protein BS47DRAFT_1347000 [Hydnum rufescens UP504]|uniref:Transmembrane protein n=1 Tax=Hydnum rufescens UP504 TaxID=1448309 RepID=A0A9P6ASB3_9AGAM|nr:hypothetical protein BS47DRAFT_1347000 [Hydnum rufescens UP504]